MESERHPIVAEIPFQNQLRHTIPIQSLPGIFALSPLKRSIIAV